MKRNLAMIGLIGAAVITLASSLCAAQSSDIRETTVVEGINSPGSMAVLPDGSILVTERHGRLLLVRNGAIVEEPVAVVPGVYYDTDGQGGLLDVALHPDFDTNGLVYFSYSFGDESASATRVTRGRLVGMSLMELEDIFTAFPMKDRPNHYGGRIAFLPDGTLLVSSGDRWTDRVEAQVLNSDIGKILRLNADGSIPSDNPFIGREGVRPGIWSYGHRIPQGLAVDPLDGSVYATESGPWGGDEFNVITAGSNYGWPITTHGKDYNGAQISPYTEYEGMESPLIVWTPEITPYGLAVYRGDLFPDWQGDIISGGYYGDVVRIRETSPGVYTEQERLIEGPAQSLRDVRVGPDGAIYLLIQDLQDMTNGKIVRVTPQ